MVAPRRAARALTLLALAVPQAMLVAGAQAAKPSAPPAPLGAAALRVTSPSAVAAEAGSAFTLSIRVANASRDSVVAVPRISVPAGWSTLLGGSSFVVAPGGDDTWLVSVRVPTRALAGRYQVELLAVGVSRETLLHDTVLVDVRARRAVELVVAERPAYAVSGTTYRGAFLVHNRGNIATTFALRATSTLGTVVDAATRLALAPDESHVVHVSAAIALPGQAARDDVLQLTATDQEDSTSSATASLQLTVVQRAGTVAPLHTVASTLRLRAAGTDVGVSPFELIGSGRLRDGGSEELEYVLRGRTSPGSLFGEREEYHVAVRGQGYATQLGDGFYLASPLTSLGQRGFGAGIDIGDSTVGGGGFAQRSRFAAVPGSERAAFLRLGHSDWIGSPRIGLSAVDRQGGDFAGRVMSATSRLNPLGDVVVDVELAGSRTGELQGRSSSARMRAGALVHLDAGHVEADPNFAGPGRGSQSDFASLSAPWRNEFQLVATTGTYRRGGSGGDDVVAQFQRTSNLELTYDNRLTLGYEALDRQGLSRFSGLQQSQRGVLARLNQPLGLGRVWGTAGTGLAHNDAGSPAHGYEQLALGGNLPLGVHTVSLYADASRGAALLRGSDRVLTLGADARLQLARATLLSVVASDTRTDNPGGGYTGLDAILTHALPNGSQVAMRLRLVGRGVANALEGRKLAYLEYSMPLALPVGPSRAAGRVRGRVVDQQSGRGVANTLVRLGPQAALTDDDGRVAFAGLPSGAYRVTLVQPLASGSSVFTGDATVAVDTGRRRPATFNLAIEPPGTVSGAVRRFVVARTGLGAAPDSLVDGGALEGMTVALAGARDTVYRVTDARGVFTFTDVPGASWTLILMAEPPAQTQWEADKIPIVLRAGGREAVTFKLLPRRRRVRIVSGDGIDDVRQR